MTTAVPVAVYGREPSIHIAVNRGLLPDYDVVHSCTGLSSAKAELPSLCAGDVGIAPSSGIGSNGDIAASKRKTPRFVLIGSGIPDIDVEQVTPAIMEAAPAVRIIRVSKEDMRLAGAVGPDVEKIVKVFREKLDKER
ncbi:hypothetical protein NCS52_00781000 [Fusarium sp. LHS14.1]|nr:hypothetical protein NCS52_00781000 [Fusarium sp. LHS14.1]